MKMELRRRALDKMYKRRDRIDMPDFQREEVWSEEQKRSLIDTIKAALKFLELAFPREATELRNRASVLSVCMLAAKAVESGVPRATARQFGAFTSKFFADLTAEVEKGADATDTDLLGYQEAISYGSTGGDSIRSRLNILSQRLVAFDSAFNAVLPEKADGNGSPSGLGTMTEEISALIYQINERSSATTGEDTFKLTNKSARAIKKLASPCRSGKDFEDLIDSLYFIVYEGS